MGSEAPGRSYGGARDRQSRALRRVIGAVVLALFVLALGPSTVAGAPATVTLTVEVVQGQGRVTTEPSGTLDCPGTCAAVVSSSAVVTLRMTPAPGYELTQRFGCDGLFDSPTCTVEMRGFDRIVHVYFAPAGKLELIPAGDGDLLVSPAGTNDDGTPADPVCEGVSTSMTPCVFRYLPGTSVVVTARAQPPSTFNGWSLRSCAGTGQCTVRVTPAGASAVGRFSPLPLNVLRGGNGTGSIVSMPSGVSCPPACSNVSFAPGTLVTLVARPDPAFPFVSWKFGCTVAPADPLRCTVRVVSDPQWVGVALGEDAEIGQPSSVSVLFDVARDGRGRVRGGEIDCGERCAARYTFGREETLLASPATGWRFTAWQGACEPRRRCTLLVGPVTSLGARFTENLLPRLLNLAVRRRAGRREIVVRIGVTHAARAVVRLRQEGGRVLPPKTYALKGGVTNLIRPVARSVPAGRYRVTLSLSDGLGGGRTFTRVRRLGPP